MFSNKNFIASVFMVTASSMGAGFLALPMVASGPNFIFSACLLILMAIFSYFLSINALEIYILYKGGVNLLSVAKNSFGRVGGIFAGTLNCLYSYILLMVYIIGGGDLFQKTIFPLLNIKAINEMGMIVFLAVLLPFFLFNYTVVAKLNQYIFGFKLFCFLTTIFIGVHYLSFRILDFELFQLKYLLNVIPIYIGALTFQTVIPIVARINSYNRAECRKIFAIGVSITVLLYILWIAILLSLIPRSGEGQTFESLLLHKESVGQMVAFAVYNNLNVPFIMKLGVGIFSNIAIITVFLISGLSAYEYWRDGFNIQQKISGRIINLLMTILIPILFAICFPKGFITIYKQVMIISLLTFIIPLICCLKQYNNLEVKLSKLGLYLLIIICLLIIIIQILDDFKLFPIFPFN